MRAGRFLFLVFGLCIAEGVTVLPCNDTGTYTDVTFGQETVFTCSAKGPIQWRIQFGTALDSELLAQCQEDSCYTSTDVDGLFVAKVIDGHRRMIVNPVNGTKVWDMVQLMNGSLVCTETTEALQSAQCDLHFVYPPEKVHCRAANASWTVAVSCVIGSIYSSRGIYKCHLFQLKDDPRYGNLETTDMLTSPSSENVTNNDLKMSGSCHFNTTLPAEEGRYGLSVAVSPGGKNYSAKFTGDSSWFFVERPSPPRLSCKPKDCVLGSTPVRCKCSSQRLGQPMGHLQWFMGNLTHHSVLLPEEEENVESKELYYMQIVTMEDHNETWLTCAAVWGTEVILGEKYTACVRTTAWQYSCTASENDAIRSGSCVHDGMRCNAIFHLSRLV